MRIYLRHYGFIDARRHMRVTPYLRRHMHMRYAAAITIDACCYFHAAPYFFRRASAMLLFDAITSACHYADTSHIRCRLMPLR